MIPTVSPDQFNAARKQRTTVSPPSAATARTLQPFDSNLQPIIEKVTSGIRLTAGDGLLLYNTPDIWTVCELAHLVRTRLHGDTVFFNINRHINYSNVCALSCTFCSFYRKKDDDGAYQFELEEIIKQAGEAERAGATELHIVGGLHPWLKFDYYLDMLRAIRQTAPRLHIKAFTAVEIVHFARIAGRARDGYEGIKSVLADLRDAGLGSLPGGGAEVFDDRVHDEAFKGKIKAGKWLEVHRAAHELGMNSNATMLYGHIESRADRIQHMITLREQQDRALHDWAHRNNISLQENDAVVLTGPDESYTTARLPSPFESAAGCEGIPSSAEGYFQTIIPLPFIPDDSALQKLPGPSGMENLRTLAISRLMLDNFPHVKAFWIMQTLEMAQYMLTSGADDIDGTVVWYDITKVGGTTTHQETTIWDLQRAIRECGLTPVERDTLYRPITRTGADWQLA